MGNDATGKLRIVTGGEKVPTVSSELVFKRTCKVISNEWLDRKLSKGHKEAVTNKHENMDSYSVLARAGKTGTYAGQDVGNLCHSIIPFDPSSLLGIHLKEILALILYRKVCTKIYTKK